MNNVSDPASFFIHFPPEILIHIPGIFIQNLSERPIHIARNPQYDVWARQGLFTLTDGNVIDYDVIRAKVKELAEVYDIREIAFDRWNAQQVCTQLEGDGLTMVQFGQGYSSMSAPTKRLMELVLEGSLAHGGNPVLRWMAANTMVTTDPAGNVKPDKGKSREKIDGTVSTIMALGRASVNPIGQPNAGYFSPMFV